jgi:hypothetical protein
VIALGNPRAARSLRLQEKDVPAERPAENVHPALAFNNVGTKWQSSRIRLEDSRIFSTAQLLPSPEPLIPSLPQLALRFLHPTAPAMTTQFFGNMPVGSQTPFK